MIYLVCFAISIFCAYSAEKTNNRQIFLLFSAGCILFPSLLAGCRAYTVGTDTGSYVAMFSIAQHSDGLREYFLRINNVEWGYLILTYMAAKVWSDAHAILFMAQIIIMICVYYGAWQHRNSVSVSLIMAIFFLEIYCQSLNITRQCIAVAILFAGIHWIERGRYVRYLPYLIIACSMHIVAVTGSLFIITDWFTERRIKRSICKRKKVDRTLLINQVGLIVLAVLFIIFSNRILIFTAGYIPFLNKFIPYLHTASAGRNTNRIDICKYVCIFAAAFFYRETLKRKLANFEFYRMSSMVLIFLLVFAYMYAGVGSRIYMAFEMTSMITLAAIPLTGQQKRDQLILSSSIIFLLTAIWIYLIVYRGNGAVYPYVFALNGI